MLNMHFQKGKKYISTVISTYNCVQDLNQQKSVKKYFFLQPTILLLSPALYGAVPFVLLYTMYHVRGQTTEKLLGCLEKVLLYSG